MFKFIMKTLVLIQLCSLAFGQVTSPNVHNSVDYIAGNVNGVKFFSISTAKFFEGSNEKKTMKILESGIEHSIGMIVPTSFAVDNDVILISSVPTSEIKSFSKTGNFIKSYGLQCEEACEPNYFSILQSGFLLINTWKTSDLRIVDTTDGQAMEWLSACSFKNWVREDNFILCEKGQMWHDNKLVFSNLNKLNEPMTNFFDYFFLDSTLVISLYVDDNTNELMYQLVDNRQDSKTNSISLPVKIDNYQAVHIIDGDRSRVRFLILSDDYRNDKMILLDLCSKKTLIFGLNIEYSGRSFIGEAAVIWPGRVVYNFSNDKLYSLITDKDSITVFNYEIGSF